MKKLIQGILDFRKNLLPSRRELFAKLAAGQAPDVLFITCSDSRVAPNWFASTDPGDLFVIRNVGNMVPPCDASPAAEFDHSVAAAIEFCLSNLKVTDIVVCGHSGCGAIQALSCGIEHLHSPHLKQWLSTAERSLRSPSIALNPPPELSPEDFLSQRSTLQQVENLKTYPEIRARFEKGTLRLHAWWFDIAKAGVYAYTPAEKRFLLIDGSVAEALLEK